MACSLAFPCGGAARLVVVLADAALYECFGSAHTIRVGVPPPALKVGHVPQSRREWPPSSKRLCAGCRKPLEAGRSPHARMHLSCRIYNKRLRDRRGPKKKKIAVAGKN